MTPNDLSERRQGALADPSEPDQAASANRFAGLQVGIITDRVGREAVFRQRHRAYLDEGAITARPVGWFADAYDFAMTSLLFAVRDASGEVVGSIRFAVQPPRAAGVAGIRSAPEFAVFEAEIARLAGERHRVASGARFAVSPGHPRRTEIALLLVYALIHAGRAVSARWGVATARGGHLRFYRRILHMTPIGPSRRMPGLEYDYTLLATDIEADFTRILNGFPVAARAHFDRVRPYWGAEVALLLEQILPEVAA